LPGRRVEIANCLRTEAQRPRRTQNGAGQLIHHEGTKGTKNTKKKQEEKKKNKKVIVLFFFVFFVPFVPSW
jgi:hypothetical protein